MKLIKKIVDSDLDILYDLEARFIICESYKSIIKSVLTGIADINNEKFDKYVGDYIEIFGQVQLYRNTLVSKYIPDELYVDNLVNFINKSIEITTDDPEIQKELLNYGYICKGDLV